MISSLPTMSTDLDPRDYIQAPTLDIPSAIALGTALQTARPKGAPEHVKLAAKRLRKAVKSLEAAYQTTRPAPTVDALPIDRRVDIAWGSLFRRLDSLAELPPTTCPRAAQAAALRDRIFPLPGGLSFLTLAFTAEWAEVKMRLDRIDAEGLAASIDTLAGAEYLPELRASFEAYGKALNVTQAAEERAVAESRLALLQEVGAAIRDYSIAVLGTRLPANKKNQDAVRAALAPLIDHRARARTLRHAAPESASADPGAGAPPT